MVLAPEISATTSIPASGRAAEARRRRDLQKRHGQYSPGRSGRRRSGVDQPAARDGNQSTTSPLDLAAVKQAIELAQKGRPDEATNVEGTIYDPVARKLVEWVILRSDEADLDFPRYAAFIAANPGWPGILFLRRRAEAALWQQQLDPRTVIAFFANEPARTAKGRFALARALLAAGDRPGAQALVSAAWRKDGFSADVEAQARQVVRRPDHARRRQGAHGYALRRSKTRRPACGRRTSLAAFELAIAKARSAVIDKSAKAKTLLDEIPIEARHDAGYLLSRIQWLRRSEKISEAAQLMLARRATRKSSATSINGGPSAGCWHANCSTSATRDRPMRWRAVPRRRLPRIIAPSSNSPPDGSRCASWASRRSRSPILRVSPRERPTRSRSPAPITGKAAPPRRSGAGKKPAPTTRWQPAIPTAYYGQLARARLGIGEVSLRSPPELSADHRRLEVARAFEILYALDERDLASVMAVEFADKATDVHALAALGEIAAQHNDARAALLIGKTALGHGLPLEHYAFPDFGVPDYEQIGPQVERCVVFSIVRQESAFNPKVISSANALGLMQVTPGAGRDTAKRFNVAFNQHRLLVDVPYNAQLGTAELGNDIASLARLLHPRLRRLQCRTGPRAGWIAKYGDPRDPEGGSDRLGRAHSALGDAQLCPAGDGEYAGLPRPA